MRWANGRFSGEKRCGHAHCGQLEVAATFFFELRAVAMPIDREEGGVATEVVIRRKRGWCDDDFIQTLNKHQLQGGLQNRLGSP
jgi:hypothetical protein